MLNLGRNKATSNSYWVDQVYKERRDFVNHPSSFAHKLMGVERIADDLLILIWSKTSGEIEKTAVSLIQSTKTLYYRNGDGHHMPNVEQLLESIFQHCDAD